MATSSNVILTPEVDEDDPLAGGAGGGGGPMTSGDLRMKPPRLTARELERGWVEFVCPVHGALVFTAPSCVVHCRCGRRARRGLNGTVLKGRDIERHLKTVQESLQTKGSILESGGSQRRTAPKRPRPFDDRQQRLREAIA